MEYTEKIIRQSNYCYNDGLKKAKIRDLSGAVTSLKKSLQYNQRNTDARNLLGLVYYARGEIAEAIVEWIISQNLKKNDNLASHFLRKMQASKKELETMDRAVRIYNQCLLYCEQGEEDVAIIQLRRAIELHPFYLKAYQLLALLYLKTEQNAKARQMLKKAHRLDTTNETTLRYMHELSRTKKKPETGKESVMYKNGNETIIQPTVSPLRDNIAVTIIVNIVIGILVGAAAVWFLIVPELGNVKSNRNNQSILAFKEELNSKDAQIRALKKELETFRNSTNESETAVAAALAATDSYEKLMAVNEQFTSGDYSHATVAKQLMEIQKDALGDKGKVTLQTIADTVYPLVCEENYVSAKNSYNQKSYAEAIPLLEEIMRMDEHYLDGEAMLLLADCYEMNKEKDKASELYSKIIEMFPKTNVAKKAEKAGAGIPANRREDSAAGVAEERPAASGTNGYENPAATGGNAGWGASETNDYSYNYNYNDGYTAPEEYTDNSYTYSEPEQTVPESGTGNGAAAGSEAGGGTGDAAAEPDGAGVSDGAGDADGEN